VREVLTSIPRRKRESKEYRIFSRKLKGLVALEFVLSVIATLVFVFYSSGDHQYGFNKLHQSIYAISPVYISFNLLEMLQSFIHGPFAPIPQDVSALRESDFADESHSPQVHTSRMDIESTVASVPFEMQDFEESISHCENNSSPMHELDFVDSSIVESVQRGRWFKGGRGKIWK
jgi:hypothetical protein